MGMSRFRLASQAVTSFPLACAFIDRFMPTAHPSYVTVYLYGLRQCYAEEPRCDYKACASALHILESDVARAWEYWESQGVVRLIKSDLAEQEPSIEFLDIAAQNAIEAKSEMPHYDIATVTQEVSKNNDLKQMLSLAETLLGKPLSRSETVTLYGFFDSYNLPPDVILLCIEHCLNAGKKSMHYIDAVARAWAEAGVVTVEKAASHLEAYDQKKTLKRQYKKLLSLPREITDAEYAFLVEWLKNEQFGDELILEAKKRTERAIGKVSFRYMNAILDDWKQEGITSKEALAAQEKTASSQKGATFSAVSQRSDYDIEEIRRRDIEANARLAESVLKTNS